VSIGFKKANNLIVDKIFPNKDCQALKQIS
jgi:hypothetical protein